MIKFFAVLLTLVGVVSCSKNCDIEIASDQLKFSDSMTINSTVYYLYTLTTGWNDKAVYFQLYDEKPKLNECKEINVKPLYEVVYDDFPEVQYVDQLLLKPEATEKLKIIYTKNKYEGISSVYDVKFTR